MTSFRYPALFLAALLVTPGAAYGGANLKKIQVTDGSRIDLFFDSKVGTDQIRTEYFNDIIQVSLSDVSVYPAKISSVSGMDLTKVFAYQYAPKLTRCRLTVKGAADNFRKRFEAKANGKVLTLRVIDAAGASDQISRSAASADRAAPTEPAKATQYSAEEKELLNRVLHSTPGAPAQAAGAAAVVSTGSTPITGSSKVEPLASGKPLPSPWRSFLMLGIVLAVFGAVAWVVKKARGASVLQKHRGLAGLVGKIPGLSSKEKIIEIVASHHLGPKKSIAVARIGGRLMVLGVTAESINLISQLDTAAPDALDRFEDQLEDQLQGFDFGAGAMSAGPARPAPQMQAQAPAPAPAPQRAASPANPAAPRFADPNGGKAYARAAYAAAPQAPADSNKPSIRAQIRSRVEGMKQI